MKRTAPSFQVVVQWIFRYGQDRVTCAVQRGADGAFLLSIVPNGREQAALTERLESLVVALQRHAAIAEGLRSRGWTLAGYAGTQAGHTRRSRRAA